MNVKSIAPGSNERLRLLITKAAETADNVANMVSCPHKKARLQARAESIRQRAKEM